MNSEALLTEVSAEAPCGENLEYDAEYLELMRISQGVPERQVGDSILAAEEPNWRDVRKQSVALFGRTKDLLVALRLCEAMLRLEGLPGFHGGLGTIRQLMERYWEQLHPQLDPSDDNDPTLRLNILIGLTDPDLFLSKLRAVPLTNSVTAGRYSLREIAWATGRAAPPEGVEPPKADVVEAAFKDTPPDELRASVQAVDGSIEEVRAIDALLSDRVGGGSGVDFEPLIRVLTEIGTELRRRLPNGAPQTSAGGNGSAAPGGAQASRLSGLAETDTAGHAGGNGHPAAPGEIRSPDDVVAAIERICDYYARLEPSSPVPLLLRRAQRLVGKGFLDIVRDLSPDVVKQIEALGGISSDAAEGDSA